MRILTAGESHGPYMTAILEGFPKGIRIEEAFINRELRRRMSGAGRGRRMSIENDKAEIASGLRNKITLGSPITLLVKNKDVKIFPQGGDNLAVLSIPRPAHADLAGSCKYHETDVRNILERASARQTVSFVCIGAVCKQFLANFKIKIASFTVSIGSVISPKKPANIAEIISKAKNSKLNCIDREKEKSMLREIEKAEKDKDSLGGVIQLMIEGVCAGVGDFTHFDKRLDAILSYYLMGIPAVKGVEVGLGFEYARQRGSWSHDQIGYSSKRGFYRKTNNSGGIEGGISTGEPIIVRLAMKPIATLRKPLESVNLVTRKKENAIVERSDTCAVSACGVIAESMAAVAITESFLDKFSADTLKDIKTSYQTYVNTLR